MMQIKSGIPVIVIDRELEGCISVCIDLEAIYKITSLMIEEHHVKNINCRMQKEKAAQKLALKRIKRERCDHNLEVTSGVLTMAIFGMGQRLRLCSGLLIVAYSYAGKTWCAPMMLWHWQWKSFLSSVVSGAGGYYDHRL